MKTEGVNHSSPPVQQKSCDCLKALKITLYVLGVMALIGGVLILSGVISQVQNVWAWVAIAVSLALFIIPSLIKKCQGIENQVDEKQEITNPIPTYDELARTSDLGNKIGPQDLADVEIRSYYLGRGKDGESFSNKNLNLEACRALVKRQRNTFVKICQGTDSQYYLNIRFVNKTHPGLESSFEWGDPNLLKTTD